MAKYDKTKKYWLQLKEDWFEEDAIKWIEDQKNGKEYSLFYMKLMLKSIKTNGILIRQVGKMLIPYEPQSIADLTRTEVDTVIVAMELLKKVGLVEILEDGAIYILQVQKMIGFTTEGALRKQEQLAKKEDFSLGWNEGGKNSTKDKDKDKDKDIIKDKYISEQVAVIKKSQKQILMDMVKEQNFDSDLIDKLETWLTYKIEKKSLYKETGFKIFLKQFIEALNKYDKKHIINCFDTAMANNWQGVFYENGNNVKVEQESEYKRRMKNDTSGFYG